MASQGNQQVWVPYETTKDCNLGFCSVYCQQWCYIIFPPPPPFELADDSSGPAFSPLVIAIIGILASAFLLVTYYAIISRYCARLDFLLRHLRASDAEPQGPSGRHEAWDVSPSDGLDEALINKISVYRYKQSEGLVDGTDCSVCLSEFREDENLRLLPKCSHAFHIRCIDTWLKSHSNCPLCRANIASVPLPFAAPPEPLPNPPASQNEANNHEPVPVIEEVSHRSGEAESTPLGIEGDVSKDTSLILCRPERLEERHGIVEIAEDEGQAIRRSFSMDDVHRGQASIADVLRLSMDEEFFPAEDHGLSAGAESSRHGKDGGRGRGLHNVMSPVPMKRSFSGGRFCFPKQGRGRNSLLPI